MVSIVASKCRSAAAICVGAVCVFSSAPAKADGVSDAMGLISNYYGAFQAGQFVAGLLFGGTADAGNAEILSAIRQDRDDRLYGTVKGLLDTMETVKSDPTSPLANNIIADWIGRADEAREQIIVVIGRGDPVDAQQLGPALNLLTALDANVLLTAGFPMSEAHSRLAKTFQANFQMIGACKTSRTVSMGHDLQTSYPMDMAEGSLWKLHADFYYPITQPNSPDHWDGWDCNPLQNQCRQWPGPPPSAADPDPNYNPFPFYFPGTPGRWDMNNAWYDAAAAEMSEPVYRTILTAQYNMYWSSTFDRVTAADGTQLTWVFTGEQSSAPDAVPISSYDGTVTTYREAGCDHL